MASPALKEISVKQREFKDGTPLPIQRGVLGKPDVFLVRTGEGSAVVKDVGKKPFLFKWTVGLWLIDREWKIYSRLKGLPGIPQPLKRINRFSFSISFVPARPIHRGALLPPSFFKNLEKILEGMHARGVVHLDLRHKGNILISETGTPFLVDFNSGIHIQKDWLRRALLPLLQWIDYGGILKLKERVIPSSLTPGEQKILNRINRLRKLWVFS